MSKEIQKMNTEDYNRFSTEELLQIADILKQYPNYRKTKTKHWLTYIQAPTLSKLIEDVNNYNKENIDSPILRDDVVKVLKQGENWLLLYYK